jgi:hypothetical protein
MKKSERPTRFGGNGVAPLHRSLAPGESWTKKINENKQNLFTQELDCMSCHYRFTGALDSECPFCGSMFTIASNQLLNRPTIADRLLQILIIIVALAIFSRVAWVMFTT